jgi:hypothetical protein
VSILVYKIIIGSIIVVMIVGGVIAVGLGIYGMWVGPPNGIGPGRP